MTLEGLFECEVACGDNSFQFNKSVWKTVPETVERKQYGDSCDIAN